MSDPQTPPRPVASQRPGEEGPAATTRRPTASELWETPASPAGRPTGPPPLEGWSSPSPQRRSRRRLILVIAILVLLTGGATAVIVLSGRSKKPVAGPTTPSSPSPSPSPVVFAPTGVTSSVDLLKVTITWTQPTGGVPVAGYIVYRNNAQMAELPASETTFTDTSARPRTYTYGVLATTDGALQSDLATIEVKVDTPPLTKARVEGTFNVKTTAISQDGYLDPTGGYTLGWSFDPKCDEKACDVVWKDINDKEFTTTLHRKGLSYTGSDSGKFNVTCGGAVLVTKLAISFKVVRATALDGEWRASTIQGSLTQSEEPQLGCAGSQAVMSLAATLLG